MLFSVTNYLIVQVLLVLYLVQLNYTTAAGLLGRRSRRMRKMTSSSQYELVLETENGPIGGTTRLNYEGKKIYSFQGIPYAAPPIGPLRFKPPQPVSSVWSPNILNATTEGNSCFQYDIFLENRMLGQEDCLYLNVYMRNDPKTDTALKPVMFFIHGGGYVSGSGYTTLYDPAFLLLDDVVLITVNYRLGLLGFLSFDDPDINCPGNNGLKDLVHALKWVKRNIQNFGGDPNNVTIFGESAGGAAVHYLILSKMGKHLFHKAIMESGVVYDTWALGRKISMEHLNQLGITNETDPKQFYKYLQNISVDELFGIQMRIPDSFDSSYARYVVPVIESKCCPSDEPFLDRDPLDILKSGDYNHVPMIMGYNSGEGMIIEKIRANPYSLFFKKAEASIPFNLELVEGSEASLDVAKKIEDFYFGGKSITEASNPELYNLATDTFIFIGIVAMLKQHLIHYTHPIYFYRFNLDTTLNFLKAETNVTEPGATHTDELSYIFKNKYTPTDIQPNSNEDWGIRTMVKLWTNFVRTSNPTPTLYKNDELSINWTPVDDTAPEKLDFLRIDNKQLAMDQNPDPERLNFWRQIYREYFPRKDIELL